MTIGALGRPAFARANAERLMRQTCTIARQSVVAGTPGTNSAFATVASGVKCALGAGLPSSLIVGPLVDIGDHTLSVPVGTDVRRGDRIAITGDPASEYYWVVQAQPVTPASAVQLVVLDKYSRRSS